MKYIIVTKIKWSKQNFKTLNSSFKIFSNIKINKIRKISPNIIFFIHWSKKIPSSIFNNYLCIQFHSSDLPKFRGGSPIQHQIFAGKKKTKISAFRVSNKIDSGEICLKKNLVLKGNANEIYKKMEKTSISMIKSLSKKRNIIFYKQKGKPTYFKRRKIYESDLNLSKNNLKGIYDFIRMLDANNYPKAFVNFKKYKVLFQDAKLLKNNELKGVFKIVKNKNN